jgi:Domain of unknown function (DUF4190)
MTDAGRSGRDPEVRPSKFGAGYTVGGPPAAPTQAAPGPPPPVPGTRVQGAPPPPMPPPPMPPAQTNAAPMPTGPMPTIALSTRGPATGAIPHAGPPGPEIRQVPLAESSRAATDSGSNVLARISLALVVVFGAFISPVTLVMAYIARAQIKKTGQRGADIAFATLVVSYVFLGIGLISVGLLRYGAI